MKKLLFAIFCVFVFFSCDTGTNSPEISIVNPDDTPDDTETNSPETPIVNPGDTPDNPISRIETCQLTTVAWATILNEIEAAGKYVDLDLSACTRGNQSSGAGLWNDGTFNPDSLLDIRNGKNKIVNLILPEAANRIAEPKKTGEGGGLDIYEKIFMRFDTLKSITGTNITNIPFQAFRGLGLGSFGCLTSINFPKVTTIGRAAFFGCMLLRNVNIPKVEIIEGGAFQLCNVQNLYLPEVTYIGGSTFAGDTNLKEITLGKTPPRVDESVFGIMWGDTFDIVIRVPHEATGYGIIPYTYIGGDDEKNWGNAFRGMGWDPENSAWNKNDGYGVGYDGKSSVNPYVTLTIEYIP